MKTRLYILLQLICVTIAFAQSSTPFAFRNGDRVAFIGDTLMEREQYYGYIELALTAQAANQNVIFRNLGWSADTPEGASRSGLSLLQAGQEPADEGWNRLLDQIDLVKPTVVFLGYGMANSFAGEKGVPKFVQGMNKLIDALLKKNPETRLVLLSPIRHEYLGGSLPDPALHNIQLRIYASAIEKIARERRFPFISLFTDLKLETDRKTSRPLTDNGIHLNALGYQKVAEVIEHGLGWKSGEWKRNPNVETLRKQIVAKNEIWFNRSRPQNMAYLLGFRKAEQGRNAKEIPEFDQQIAGEEKKMRQFLDDYWIPKKKLSTKTTKKTAAATPPPAKIEHQERPDFQLADGVEVTLWAEDPMLAKPIQINFDPQGRLWAACSAVYPQIEPNHAATDKIIVLEDTNGDGKADKTTTFVDGLLVPTAVVPGDGGVYVGQSTDLLFFKDTDGDGKADEARRVLSGFGTEDTHHNIHTLRWGPDGHLYFNQSIYIRTDTETPNGVVRLKSGGVLNLQAQEMDLETYLYGFCNSWGHAFDEFGQSFTTDGCGSQGISYGIRSATYLTYAGMRRELKSISPGSYPKFCGLEIIRSQMFPADWQNNFITSDFRGHRVVRFKVTEDGAGYAAQELSPEIMRTTNTTFRPIDAKVGPDGAIYIADWSNPIINHGEVDFRDPRRDHEHGRIWRVTWKNNPPLKTPKLTTLRNTALFEELLSPNDFNRNQSRRVLTERGAKIKRDLDAWTQKQTDGKALLEALWVYQSIDEVNLPLLKKVLKMKDGRIRAAAIRVASAWMKKDASATSASTADAKASPIYDLVADSIYDPHPRVRLETVRALPRVPSARSAEVVLTALFLPMDSFLDYAVWLSINELAQPWLDAVKSGAWKVEGREQQLEFGLKAIDPALSASILEKVLEGRKFPKDGKGPWLDLIGKSGGPNELRHLFDQVLENGFNDAATARALNALDEASRLRGLKPSGDLEGVGKFLDSANPKIAVAAIKLCGTWNLASFVDRLLNEAATAKAPAEVRTALFDSLRQIGGEKVTLGLLALAAMNDEYDLRKQALVTVGAVNLDKALPELLDLAVQTTNETTSVELWRAILGIKGAGPKVAKALPKEIPSLMAKTALKVAREGGRSETELVLAITRSANLDDAEKNLTPEELKQLTDSVSKGDPSKGETLYRSANLACSGCHAIGGAGGKVGPDLTSIGASAPVDYLIESLLYPNKKIKEGYHSIIVSTKTDQEFSGVLVRESDTELVLRDASNKEMSIPKNTIDHRKNGLSLMPAGLTDNLSEDDRASLVRFLSELGKPGKFDATKGNVARVWKLFVMTSRQEALDQKIVNIDPSLEDWISTTSTVEGRLLRTDLEAPLPPRQKYGIAGVYAAAKLQLANPAKIHLKFAGAEKSSLWIDGKAATINSDTETELAQGKHTIVLRLDPQKLPEYLRMESSDGTFLTE